MLSAEKSQLVRLQIANVLSLTVDQVVPEARLFGDLRGTPEHLKPLRLAMEAALQVQIEPIVNEINARTAVGENGQLTQESLRQITDFLGHWPAQPQQPVTFPDLFTVSMIEAIVAKAGSFTLPTLAEPRLELSPPLKKAVYQAISKILKVPVEQLHPDMEIHTPGKELNFKFSQSLFAAERATQIGIGVELDDFATGLEAFFKGTATAITLQKLRRLIPNIESLPDDGQDHTSTVGLIERMFAAADVRRKGPVSNASGSGGTSSQAVLGTYIAAWPQTDREWWISLPGQMGAGPFRLYLTGMLRAAFVERGCLNRQVNEALEAAEQFAETSHCDELRDKKFRGVNSWKLGRNPLWTGLLHVLKPECAAEDGGPILERVQNTFIWDQAQVIRAARAWQQSLVSPLKEPREFDVTWVTEEIAALARQMYKARLFIDVPKLGPLLETAGCSHAAVLDHCRDPHRRHLRGDWLINAILAVPLAPPKKTTRARSSAAAKPKKVKFPTLSSRMKRHYKESLTHYTAGIPVASAWALAWQSDHGRNQHHLKRDHPHLSAELLTILAGLYPARVVAIPKGAIARRMELQSATELHIALSLWARMSLVIWLTRPDRSTFLTVLHDAFAAGDEVAIQWALREFPHDPKTGLEIADWDYLALRAIATRDDALGQTLIDRWTHPAIGSQATRFQSGLLSILQRHPQNVVAHLNQILNDERNADEPTGFGVMSLPAHALYRAANWIDPELVAEFDVTQSFPWDAEYHAVSTATPNALDGFDFSNTPAVVRDLLLAQNVPDWLRQLPLAPQEESQLHYCQLTELGPDPDAVRVLLESNMQWNTAECLHRASQLPLTLCLPKYLTDRIAREMAAAGATVIVKKVTSKGC